MPAKSNKKSVIRFSLFYKGTWKSRYNQRNGLNFFHCVALNTPSLHPCHACCIPSVRPHLTLVSSRYTADTLSPSRQQTNSFLVWSTYAFVVHGLWYLFWYRSQFEAIAFVWRSQSSAVLFCVISTWLRFCGFQHMPKGHQHNNIRRS